MPKFTPTLSDREYNLKLVAIINNDTTVYTYLDDDNDQMLVRCFDDDTRLPYVKGKLSLKLNPKTGRKYTVLDVIDVGTKEDFKEIEIPAPWKRGTVETGEALRRTLTDAVDEAIEAVERIDEAADIVEDQWQHVTHDESVRLTRKSRERITEAAELDAFRICEPLLTSDINELYKIREAI